MYLVVTQRFGRTQVRKEASSEISREPIVAREKARIRLLGDEADMSLEDLRICFARTIAIAEATPTIVKRRNDLAANVIEFPTRGAP